jgi:D-glycero-alpha-D-manno-heptose-7-phosphate kinase
MITVRAPVRISFGGGGTDLAAYYMRHGGMVVSAAITRYCAVRVGEPADGGFALTSSDYGVTERFPAGALPPVAEPLALPKAAVEWFGPHLRRRGVELSLSSEVPPGSGLGASSAMAVALTGALGAYLGAPLDPATAADTACRLEIERLGQPIGKQDHYASAFGGLNTIHFSEAGVRVEPLDLPAGLLEALSRRVLLFWTGQSRDSSTILRQQQADSGAQPLVIETLHRIKELAELMRAALLAHDLDGLGRLLDRGWHEKRRLSRRISSPAIDRWYAAAREAGALGGKVAGAGGGGFLLLYCPPRRQAALRAALASYGLRELTFDFDQTGMLAERTAAGGGRAYAYYS